MIHPNYTSEKNIDDLLRSKLTMEGTIKIAKDMGLPTYITESHLKAIENEINRLSKG